MFTQKNLSVLAVCALANIASADVNLWGESLTGDFFQNDQFVYEKVANTHIQFKESNRMPFGAGKLGISIVSPEGKWSNSINIIDGPVNHIRKKFAFQPINATEDDWANGLRNPQYLTVSDVNKVMGFFMPAKLGQVWYEKRAYGTEVFSIRQIANPVLAAAPKFGGLVIAQVPKGNNVFFGEWAPRSAKPREDSDTNLGMYSDKHTVWYAGENPTRNMPALVNAKYNIIGINNHTPGQDDFYKGQLTANFGSDSGTLDGTIARKGDSIDFKGTSIGKFGEFERLNTDEAKIRGHFYGKNAEALAGVVDRKGVHDDVAFGGHKQ